jgi:hypothetical protein
VLLTTLLQFGESTETFFCKQASASFPPGETPEQCDMKSDRQAERMALCCAAVGVADAGGLVAGGLAATTGFAAGLTGGLLAVALGCAGGGGAATVGAAGGAGAMVAWAGAGAGGGGASECGLGKVLLTAALQAGDRLLTFFCRQANASWPRMPEHFDMASLRQFALSAL